MGRDVIILLFLLLLNILLAFYQPLAMWIGIDECQYLLISKKMLEGWVPYRDIIENKPLGIYLALMPAVLLGGKDIVKLRLYPVLIAGITSFFIYLIGKKLGGQEAGLFAAGIFTFMNAFPGFYGYTMLTDPIANLLIAALFYIILCLQISYGRVVLCGVLFAAACSVRQTSVLMLVPAAFAFYTSERRVRWGKAISSFLLGVCVVFVPMLLYLVLNSALSDAVYWTLVYSAEIGTYSFESKISNFTMVSILFSPFILLALFGLVKLNRAYRVVLLWLLSGIVIAQLGYSWWHNYLFVLPPLSIFAGRGVGNLFDFKDKARGGTARVIAKAIFTFVIASVFILLIFELKTMAELHPVPSWEDQKGIGDFIMSHTNEEDRIFAFGLNTDAYYLSDRDPATRKTIFGGEMCNASKEGIDESVLWSLDANKPKYIVANFFHITNMCGNGSGFETAVRGYMNENYAYVNSWGPLELYERRA